MKYILTILFLFSFNSFASVDCSKHPIYCQIKKNKPRKSYKETMELSNMIYKVSRKYDIPANVYTAILMQESGYKLEAKNCHWGLRKLSKLELLNEKNKCAQNFKKSVDLKVYSPLIGDDINIIPESEQYKSCINGLKDKKIKDKVCTDLGMSQIYILTAERYKFDTSRLTTDLEYSIEAGAKVLADFKRMYGHKDLYWWLRYNCGTRGTTNRVTCQTYKKLVERYL